MQELDLNDLKKLLLSIDEEEAITTKNPTRPIYCYSRSGENKKIIIAGNGHVYKWPQVEQVYEMLDQFKPDYVLYEGGVGRLEKHHIDKTPEEILERYGEQGLVEWWALKNNVPAKSWDLTQKESFEVTLNESPEEIIAWVLAHVTRYFIRRHQRNPDTKDLQTQLKWNIGFEIEELESITGLKLTPEYLNNLGQKFGDTPFTEMDEDTAERLSSPRYRGKTNDPYRKIRERREENAIKEILSAKEKYDKIFVSCGTSHAVTWRPVIEAIYPENF